MNNSDQFSAGEGKTVMFADICGSTRLYEVLGDARAFSAISECLDVLRQLTMKHGGRVVKTIGDEIMSVFPDAVSATHAACEMQAAISSWLPIDQMRVAIRIGFHAGPVLDDQEGDVFGDTVNVAARMAELAQAQQIITTGKTMDWLPPIIRSSTRALNPVAIRGKADEVEVREVIWRETDDMTMLVGNTLPGTGGHVLRLSYDGRDFMVDAVRPSVTIGRDEGADIVVRDRCASRMHARIEFRRDKFVFVDLSSNGSYILPNGEEEVRLRREEFVLSKSGSISLGHPYKNDPAEIIEFSC